LISGGALYRIAEQAGLVQVAPVPASRGIGFCSQVFDGAGNENLSRACLGGDAGADVYGDTAELLAHPLALAGVNARSDFDPEWTASMAAAAQRIARAGPSKLVKKPSPAVSSSRPRKRVSSLRIAS